MPLHHLHGLVVTFLVPALHGACVLPLASFDPSAFPIGEFLFNFIKNFCVPQAALMKSIHSLDYHTGEVNHN